MKRRLTAFILVCMLASISGCSSNTTNTTTPKESNTVATETVEEKEEKILNLEGEWKQVDSDSSEMYHKAIITSDTIEIYWVDVAENSESLYWAGSYIKPSDSEKEYSWDSVNDKEKTDVALLASGEDTKTFTYKDGKLSYSASALGTTKTIELEQVK